MNNSTALTSAPQPEVQHLTTLFNRVTKGEVRIPAFQREFVWKSGQMLSLLDSVYRGFPISSLLFWRVNTKMLRTQDKRNFPPANDSAPYPHSFVLDGQQRLTTLYGAFNFQEERYDSDFNILFNLKDDRFELAKDVSFKEPYHVSLNTVFSPKLFLAAQKEILELEDGNTLIDKSIRLFSKFQEYMLPIVTIESENISDVVSIFERINNTGTKLSTVDFMRALTWSADFDLTQELNQLSEHFEDVGFKFNDEALVKSLAVEMNCEPTAPSMLSLQRHGHKDLLNAVERVRDPLQRVIDFFEESFMMKSSDFIAYEAQVVILSHLFSRNRSATLDEIGRKWFLGSSMDESLRGRSDAYIASLVRSLSPPLVASEDKVNLERVFIGAESFVERRMIKGRALSAASVLMYALRGARNLKTGDLLNASTYLSNFTPLNFSPVFPSMPLGRPGDFGSHRRIANLVLVPGGQKKPLASSLLKDRQLPDEAYESQFLTKDALRALDSQDLISFAFARGDAMTTFVDSLLDGSKAWPL